MRINCLILAATVLIATAANAQRWKDAATGKTVASGPIIHEPQQTLTGADIGTRGVVPDASDPKRAFDPKTGRNFFFDPVTCNWKDAATGMTVASGPIIHEPQQTLTGADIGTRGVVPDASDPKRAFDPKTGRNFVRDKCPPPKPKTTSQQPQTGGQVGSVPPVKLGKFEARILNVHNAERAAIGVEPLRWNAELAAGALSYAQQLARTGQRVHAPRGGRGDVRENLNQGMLGWNTDQMLRNWLDEKGKFTPGTFPDVCTGGWTRCGHYSQMIWPETTDLGCGMATGSGFKWLVCRYSPGGNKEGKQVGRRPSMAAVTAYQWIDIKTGKPVVSWPVDSKGQVIQPSIGNPNSAYDPETGQNLARENGVWIDVKTLKPVRSWPVDSKGKVIQPSIGDPNRAYDPETGRNFAREPVPAKPPK